jgi:hypothetical protein
MFLPLISQILYELETFIAAQIKNNQVTRQTGVISYFVAI